MRRLAGFKYRKIRDLQLNTIPITWLLLRKYNCMAGILFLRKSLIKVLQKFGFKFHRQAAGSHEIWFNPKTNLYITIPKHRGDLPEGTLRAILKQANITPGGRGVDLKDWITGVVVPIITIAITVILVQCQIKASRKDIQNLITASQSDSQNQIEASRQNIDNQIQESRNQELLANYQERIIELIIADSVIKKNSANEISFRDCRRSDNAKLGLNPETPCDELIVALTSYTGSIMRTLDSTQNTILIQFIQSLDLVKKGESQELLIKANLSSAKLDGAFLEGANLYRANLSGTSLKVSNLTNTDFEGSNLEDATLIDSNVNRDKQLSDAFLCRTKLGSQDKVETLDRDCEGGISYNQWFNEKFVK